MRGGKNESIQKEGNSDYDFLMGTWMDQSNRRTMNGIRAFAKPDNEIMECIQNEHRLMQIYHIQDNRRSAHLTSTQNLEFMNYESL